MNKNARSTLDELGPSDDCPHSAPHVLLVINESAFFLSHRATLAQAVRDAGFRVSIVTPDDSFAEAIRLRGFHHIPVKLQRWSLNPIEDLCYLFRLRRIYRNCQPDIVHHVTIKPVIYGTIAARLAQVPSVVNAVSGLGYMFLATGKKAALRRSIVKFLYRIALRHPHMKVIMQNPDDRALFEQAHLVRPQAVCLIRGSGVNCDTFSPTPEPEGEPVVLIVSRLLREKGIVEFCEAANLLHQRGVRARFIVAGDAPRGNPGAVSDDWLDSARRSGVVEFLGYQSDVLSLLRQCHIACLPSYREGLPKALIEAAAAGKPIVCTDTAGCREIVRHNENGLLVPIRDSLQLANALETLINDSQLRHRFGLASRRIVLEEGFSEREVFSQTIAIYQSLIS